MSSVPKVVTASNVAVVRSVLLDAAGASQSVMLRGGGTKLAPGASQTPDLVLDFAALSALESYEPGELVLRAGAGARVVDIEALLAEHDQMLAFEPPDFGPLMGRPAGASTLGGMLSAGLSGPRRIAAGAARDHFLGFEAVSGRGVAFKAGGPVVKNVTGFDLPKLMAGSWGALAALTSVTLKVMPRPKASLTLVVGGQDERAACASLSLAMGGPWSVSGAAFLPASLGQRSPLSFPSSATLLRLEGFSPSVQARASSLRQALAVLGSVDIIQQPDGENLWRWVRDLGAFWGRPQRLWRLSVPPADGWQVDALLSGLEGELLLDWAGGQVWWAGAGETSMAEQSEAVWRAVRSLGGHACLFRGEAADHQVERPVSAANVGLTALAARVKTAFDPVAVLQGGRPYMFGPA